MDTFPPIKQRPALLTFAEIADTRASCLRRDECGDWAIFGKYGHIYAVPVELNPDGSWVFPLTGAAKTGYQLVIGATVECELEHNSMRQWGADKKKLKFCRLTQDGDAEGCMILDRLPTAAEGATIRSVLGIPKRIELSEGQLVNLRAHAAAKGFQPPRPAKTPSPVPDTGPAE
jgi:hypothetical protein